MGSDELVLVSSHPSASHAHLYMNYSFTSSSLDFHTFLLLYTTSWPHLRRIQELTRNLDSPKSIGTFT